MMLCAFSANGDLVAPLEETDPEKRAAPKAGL